MEITWKGLWRVLCFVIFAAIIFYGRTVLLGLFLALVISSGLEFLVSFFERKGVPRAVGVVGIFLLAAVAFLILIYTVIPLLIVDVNTAFLTIAKLGEKSWWGPFISLRATETLNAFITRVSSAFFSESSSPFQTFSDLFGSVALAFSVVVSAFYLSLSREGVERFIRAVFPLSSEEKALRVYARSLHQIGVWFRTQIVLSFLVASMVLVTLLLLDVRYAFLLALLTAFLEIVPYVGPLIAGSLAVLAALLTSPSLAFYTLIAFTVIHQVESHLLVPLLIGRNTGLHPVIVIGALLVGLATAGILGMMVSVPIAVVVQEAMEELSPRRRREPEALSA